jgi:hypothetical protein
MHPILEHLPTGGANGLEPARLLLGSIVVRAGVLLVVQDHLPLEERKI